MINLIQLVHDITEVFSLIFVWHYFDSYIFQFITLIHNLGRRGEAEERSKERQESS